MWRFQTAIQRLTSFLPTLQAHVPISDGHSADLALCLRGAFPHLRHLKVASTYEYDDAKFHAPLSLLPDLQSLIIDCPGAMLMESGCTGLAQLTSLASLTLCLGEVGDLAPLSELSMLSSLVFKSPILAYAHGLDAVLTSCSKLTVLAVPCTNWSGLSSNSLKLLTLQSCLYYCLPNPSLLPSLLSVQINLLVVDGINEGNEGAFQSVLDKYAAAPFPSFGVDELTIVNGGETLPNPPFQLYLKLFPAFSLLRNVKIVCLCNIGLEPRDLCHLAAYFPRAEEVNLVDCVVASSSLLEAVQNFENLHTLSFSRPDATLTPLEVQASIFAASTAAQQRKSKRHLKFQVEGEAEVVLALELIWKAIAVGFDEPSRFSFYSFVPIYDI